MNCSGFVPAAPYTRHIASCARHQRDKNDNNNNDNKISPEHSSLSPACVVRRRDERMHVHAGCVQRA